MFLASSGSTGLRLGRRASLQPLLPPMGSSRRSWLVLACIVVAAQVLAVGVVLPWSALAGTATFWHIDHPYHRYQIALGRALLHEFQLVGYDPFFGGGQLGGVTFN